MRIVNHEAFASHKILQFTTKWIKFLWPNPIVHFVYDSSFYTTTKCEKKTCPDHDMTVVTVTTQTSDVEHRLLLRYISNGIFQGIPNLSGPEMG